MNGLKSVIVQEFNKALAFASFPFEALSLKMEPPPPQSMTQAVGLCVSLVTFPFLPNKERIDIENKFRKTMKKIDARLLKSNICWYSPSKTSFLST